MLDYPSENSVHRLRFPPYGSHKLKSLDHVVYGLLKSIITVCVTTGCQPSRENKHDIPEMVGHTFPKAMTLINIQAKFRVAGLVPVNRDVFEDCYFMLAKTRDCSKPVNNSTSETDNSVHDTETPSTSGYAPNECIIQECDIIQEG